jgi:hypothetical protein
MEETMLFYMIADLMHMTRNKLCDLAEQIAFRLPELEPGTVARHEALTSLDNIRKVMRSRDLAPEWIAKAKLLPARPGRTFVDRSSAILVPQDRISSSTNLRAYASLLLVIQGYHVTIRSELAGFI